MSFCNRYRDANFTSNQLFLPMAILESLLPDAAAVRDAVEEGENTALRVGQLFVSIIQKIDASFPSETIDASDISVSSDETGVSITFNTVLDSGEQSTRTVRIPAATETSAGLLTPAILEKIAEDLTVVSDSFKKFVGEVSLDELDNMTSVRYATGQLPSIYKVTFSGKVVGLLFVYSDTGSHELTQELHSTMIPQDGVVNGTHVDGEPRVLTRTYNLGSHQWSPWRGKPSFVTLSEDEYDALGTKDPDTYYYIYEDEQ